MPPCLRALAAAALALALASCYQTSTPLITAQNADWPLGDGITYTKVDPSGVLASVAGQLWREGDTYLLQDDGGSDAPAEIRFYQIRDNFYAVQRNNGSYNYDLARVEADAVYTYGLQCDLAEDAVFIGSGTMTTTDDGMGLTCMPNSLDTLASVLMAKSANQPGTTYTRTGTTAGTAPAVAAPATAQAPLAMGQTVQGQIAASDPMRDGKYYDAFRFAGTAGQTVTIVMSGDPLDTYLYLYSAADLNTALAFDDDTAGNLDARISYTLPRSGDYVIYASTAYSSGVGAYSLALNGTPVAGGAAAPQQNMIMSDDEAGQVPLTYGQRVVERLNADDFATPEGNYFDVYRFEGVAGDQIEIRMNSKDLDPYLYIYDNLDADALAFDDDGGELGSDSLLRYTLPKNGRYLVIASTFGAMDDGAYQITLTRTGGAGAASNIAGGINFGDDSSNWANNGICDDPRFEGPGMTGYIIESDRNHDATDCRNLFNQGQVTLK